MGLESKNSLKVHKEALIEHITQLEEQYNKYEKKAVSLQSSEEAVELQARNMGYYQRNQDVMIINGMGKRVIQYNPGKEIFYKYKNPFRPVYFRIVSFTLFLIVTLLIFLVRKMKST